GKHRPGRLRDGHALDRRGLRIRRPRSRRLRDPQEGEPALGAAKRLRDFGPAIPPPRDGAGRKWRKARHASSPYIASYGPRPVTHAAPQRAPTSSASTGSRPSASPNVMPAAKQSPAP